MQFEDFFDIGPPPFMSCFLSNDSRNNAISYIISYDSSNNAIKAIFYVKTVVIMQ